MLRRAVMSDSLRLLHTCCLVTKLDHAARGLPGPVDASAMSHGAGCDTSC